MKIIIAGDGKVGEMLTRTLSSEEYDYELTLIDEQQQVLEAMQEQYDVMTICGNGASMPVLQEAGIRSADLLIAVTSADEINLLCCMTAHYMNEKLHTIARVRNPEYVDQIYSLREKFALSMAVNPEKQAAEEIERLLKYPALLQRETFSRGRMEIIELLVDGKSMLKNVRLTELGTVVKCRILVCVVLRDGKTITPSGEFVIREGDRIFVTAPTDDLATLLRNLKMNRHSCRNVMVCGGSKCAYYLCKSLSESGINVKLIEKNPKRCLELAELLPRVDVIQGDATSHEFLRSEGLERADAMIAMTGIDEVNIVISLYAGRKNVPKVITKLQQEENQGFLEDMPVGSVICPKSLCANAIAQYVQAMGNQVGSALAVHSFAGGHAQAAEFKVEENTPYQNVPLKELPLKEDILLVGIKHGPTTEIPGGFSSYEKGDILVIVSSGSRIHSLNDIFE